MPIIKSAKKQVRSSARRRVTNLQRRRAVKVAVRGMHDAPSAAALSAAFKALDKAARRGTIHHGKAARLKSRLAHRLK